MGVGGMGCKEWSGSVVGVGSRDEFNEWESVNELCEPWLVNGKIEVKDD